MKFLEDLRMSLLNFNFAMIYVIHKIFILPKNQRNYLKDSIVKCIKGCRIVLFFSQHIMMENLNLVKKIN